MFANSGMVQAMANVVGIALVGGLLERRHSHRAVRIYPSTSASDASDGSGVRIYPRAFCVRWVRLVRRENIPAHP
eukprot:51260-Prorocentrum_minimum.AAC.1